MHVLIQAVLTGHSIEQLQLQTANSSLPYLHSDAAGDHQ